MQSRTVEACEHTAKMHAVDHGLNPEEDMSVKEIHYICL